MAERRKRITGEMDVINTSFHHALAMTRRDLFRALAETRRDLDEPAARYEAREIIGALLDAYRDD